MIRGEMENNAAGSEQPRHQPRRRSHRKSSKALYERRRRWKNIGLWVLACAVGGMIVAIIAVFAGRAAG
jgi:ferric-dicitrate binding protein FerR (iron transport regulator)